MSIAQKPRVRTRAVVSSRLMKMGSNLTQEYIESERARNNSVWNDKKSWLAGFYFGKGDTRLWVPKRMKGGVQHEEKRVINFAHPQGKQAAQVLMLAYLICTIGAVMVTAMILGYRW